MKHVTIIAGARPNFIKIAPIISEISKSSKFLEYSLVHTGQHYDDKMSNTFFNQLNIPKPDKNLNCGGGSHAEQTSSIMIAFEEYILKNPTDMIIVVGDVTSTMACSVVAKKMKIKLAHVEGGIRSFDKDMPEEINRLITDSISDYFFVTTKLAKENLVKEGHSEDKIFFVGNVMIDTLYANSTKLKKPKFWKKFNLISKRFLLLTLHRPSNVDDDKKFINIIREIENNSLGYKVVFPVHPRVRKNLSFLDLKLNNIILVEPQGYLEFNYLMKNSLGIITDSGGITEESTVYGVPCITLRNSTERPETIDLGTNELIGNNPKSIKPALEKLISGNWKSGTIPELWDGKSAERIIDIIREL